MRTPHLFEFMDQHWVPPSLRSTLVEITESCNSFPFQAYYRWVARELIRIARKENLENIVELGAGSAPVSRALIKERQSDGLRLFVCDINPQMPSFEALEKRFPGKIQAIRSSVDFSVPRHWARGTALVLSATFHHIPPEARAKVLAALTDSADRILIFEPVRNNWLSVALAALTFFPSLLLPIFLFPRTGKLRRLLWCWLIPVAPFLFWWDATVSCLRQWSGETWQRELDQVLPRKRGRSVTNRAVYQMVAW